MRKMGAMALAVLLGATTPVFLSETASAQTAPSSTCQPGDESLACQPYLLGILGAGLLAGLIFLVTQNHHHTQVSP